MRRCQQGRALGWVLMAGCSGQYPYVWADQLPEPVVSSAIEAGDTISVSVRNQEQLTGEFVVKADGSYTQPIVGRVEVQGLTTTSAAQALTKRLDGIITDPVVSIAIASRRSVRVSVLGNVRTPGPVEVRLGEGVLGALARAGGLNEFAASTGIYVIRKRPEIMRIRFDYQELSGGDAKFSGFRLRKGDVVVVD